MIVGAVADVDDTDLPKVELGTFTNLGADNDEIPILPTDPARCLLCQVSVLQ